MAGLPPPQSPQPSLWKRCSTGLLRLCDYNALSPEYSSNGKDAETNEKLAALSSSDDDLSPAPRARSSASSPSRNYLRHSHYTVDRSASTKRARTFVTSFRYLLNLTPQQVDDFMASYVIYNLDWKNEDEMIRELGPNYSEKVGDCLRSYYGVLNHLCALSTLR